MARVIQNKVTEAVRSGAGMRDSKSSTSVQTVDGITRVWLYGTCVVEIDRAAGRVEIQTNGYLTPTTQSRINGALRALSPVYQASFANGQVTVASPSEWIVIGPEGGEFYVDPLSPAEGI